MKAIPAFVDKVLEDYIAQLVRINPGNIVGVYLTGSAYLDDYYSNKSDIDFITVIRNEPTKDLLLQLTPSS